MIFFKYLLGCVAFFLSANLYAATCQSGINKDLSVASSIINSTQSYVCNNSCRYKLNSCVDVDIEGQVGTCAATSTGENCNGSNPDPVQPQPTELECNVDSCPNPNGLKCPTGYVSGTFNGQKICAKSKDNEPDTECDPATQNCDDLRTERIVQAVDNANADITGSVNNLGERMDGPLGAIKDGLQDISDKLTAIADKIRSGGTGGTNPDGGWGDVDTSPFNAEVPIQETEAKELDSGLFTSSAQCPANNVLSLPNYNINYQFDYSKICDFLSWFSYLVMIFAYIVAAYIVIKA
ncbi:hypothetical protein NDN11_09360 [Acinetobacter sp. C26M]|uniref:virulence factor TspB C-terminal domain-related protein n=1 Tax=unclassified Acinetobacter TaxID=196816 RepID=UPI00203673B0|nr:MULTISPECIES: virulence factor TspB C-terminal domain-related protein [unclassified Acinetobacter]USA44943.1 hypothetical protein NDN11_09360 [Acinetobacter sp. C26M]USA48446.1 hypothetical protein NDN12_09360 [Acinetobacter sp. C26G]